MLDPRPQLDFSNDQTYWVTVLAKELLAMDDPHRLLEGKAKVVAIVSQGDKVEIVKGIDTPIVLWGKCARHPNCRPCWIKLWTQGMGSQVHIRPMPDLRTEVQKVQDWYAETFEDKHADGASASRI